MAAERRRYTVSVTESMAAELEAVKGRRYPESTQNAMLQDLIRRGLEELRGETRLPEPGEGRGA